MQGGIEIFLKAVRGCLCFIEVKDMAARVVGRNLGSHCPVPYLPIRAAKFNAVCVKNFGCPEQQ